MNIVPLSRDHDRRRFNCGDAAINTFLSKGALQDQERRLSRTSVIIDELVDRQRIIGFHTILMTLVDQDVIPNDRPRIKRKIPVILLGQIAVDIEFQRRRCGNLLLTDVEERVVEVAKMVGVRSLMLDARSEELALWYEKRDFDRFPGSLRMFKTLASIKLYMA